MVGGGGGGGGGDMGPNNVALTTCNAINARPCQRVFDVGATNGIFSREMGAGATTTALPWLNPVFVKGSELSSMTI